jgi:ubiquinone/menaquinone biosynthesis C-methylase UbiE
MRPRLRRKRGARAILRAGAVLSLFVPRRRPSRELLDDENLSASEMALSLRDLEGVNRLWGTSRALMSFLLPRMRTGPDASYLVLDLGAGAGWVSRSLAQHLSTAGIRARVVRVDRQWRHLAFGTDKTGAACGAVAADAFRLPFADASADWIVSNLFLHHFSPEENVRLFREAARVARKGFAMLDISRNVCLQIFLATVGRATFRTAVSLQDGQASVRQAYTPEEALEFARDALPDASVRRLFPFRLLVTGGGNGLEPANPGNGRL